MEVLEKETQDKKKLKKTILLLLSPAVFYSIFLVMYLFIYGMICQWDSINMSISFLSFPYLTSIWIFSLASIGLYFFAKKKQKRWANLLFVIVSLILAVIGIAILIAWIFIVVWIDVISSPVYLVSIIFYSIVMIYFMKDLRQIEN